MNFQDYYKAREEPEVVIIPEATYISILGKGSPGTPIFYTKKKMIVQFAKELQEVLPLTDKVFHPNTVEIFYWYNEAETGFVDIGNFYTSVDLDLLNYRIAIRIPETITKEHIHKIGQVLYQIPFVNQVERFTYTAGKCVQLLHLGPFAGELETLPVLQEFATANGLRKSGMHQEIHLVNFEKGQSQEHLQTILRDPVTII